MDLCEDGPLTLFLDFDGTLVNIAAKPDGIAVPGFLAEGLHRLATQLDGRLALISGRAISDIEIYLGPLSIARAGSHGIERLLPDGSPLDAKPELFPAEVLERLAAFARDTGFDLEQKPHGAALHYRANPALEDEGLAFAAKLAEAYGLVIKRGKCVIELVRPGADKGGAVRAFMKHPLFSGSRPLFIGDDVTDEDGFAAVEEFEGDGILVGDRSFTKARFGLQDPAHVLEWLGL